MKYTAEEVRARINKAWQNHDEQGRVFITMGDAMALVETILPERIEADAVPAAWQYRYKNDHMQWSRWVEWVPEEHPEDPFPKMIGRWEVEYRKLFTHPPAQAAQVDPAAKPRTLADFVHAPDAERAQIGQQVATMVDEMMAEPVAQGESAWLERLKDPATVHALMLRGVIAIPSIRSMVDLRGEVPNGENVQLLRIAELQEQLAAQPAQSVDVEKVREVIAHLRSFRSNTPPTWAHLDDAADKLEASLPEKGNG